MVDLVSGGALTPADWERCYDEVLVPSFPASELISRDAFLAARGEPSSRLTLACDGDELLGLSLVDGHDPQHGVALLSYLAAAPGRRARGIGGELMAALRATEPCLLIEMEDPRHHQDAGFGDPWRRVEFYRRHGVRLLDVPYFQPPVRPGLDRVEQMLLGMCGWQQLGKRTSAAPLRSFLTRYLLEGGEDLTVDPARALVAALSLPTLGVVELPSQPGPGSG